LTLSSPPPPSQQPLLFLPLTPSFFSSLR
jgi:hypothetical protein